MHSTRTIRFINVIDGARIAAVWSEKDKHHNSHGLGMVGEPLRPFLGERAEGYSIALGETPPDVYEIDTAGRRNKRGYFPRRRASWNTLQAPDVTLEHWSTTQAAVAAENALVDEHDAAPDAHFGDR